MIYNNLNRIKGILSARQGAQIPKFEYGNKIYKKLPNGKELFSEDNGITWKHVENPNVYYENTQNTSFLEIPHYDDATRDLNNSKNNSGIGLLKIPGDLNLTPDSKFDVAARSVKNKFIMEQKINDELEAQSKAFNQQNNHLLETQTLDKSLNTSDKNKLQTIVTNAENNASKYNSAEMNLRIEQEKEKQQNIDKNWQIAGQAIGSGIQAIGGAMGAQQSATDSNLTKGVDSGVDAVGGMLSQMGGIAGGIGQILQIGSAAGQIIEGITGGTDQMTATDKFFDSGIGTVLGGWVNQLWGKNSDAFGIDQSMAATVGSSYGGSMDQLNEAARTADKKYGLFSSKARKKANENIAAMKATQNQMSNVANTAMDQRLAVQSMGEQAGLAYSMMTDGGYNQKYTYAAKHGGLLEWNPVIELEWEPQVELNWELPTFKEGGNIEISEELEWIPEFKSGNKIRTIEELIEYAKKQNPRFIQRLSEEPTGIKFIDDEGNEAEGSHYLESRGEYVVPRIQEINGELKFLSPQEAIDRAIESGNYLKMTPEEAILFAEKYKQGWPEFFKKFKKGGSVGDSDIPEIEETAQKNVIPEGALHKNKHHMEHAEGLTKKGIPVIDEDGEQQAEIEHSEIIFTLEVTKKLEEYYDTFYSEESSNKEKDQAAIDAGKLLVYQILENTEDRTGLIESCKKGGSLTLKKSTDDLIEEVLEWMPTIVVVETEESKEEKPSKKEDKSEAKNEQSEKDKMKEAIKEVLIELLVK